MKNLISVSVASALALGAAGAHASIALPSAGSANAVLFAEVISGYNTASSSVVASYAGDTGLSVNSLLSLTGTTTVLGSDQNLKNLFAADGQGDTVVFGVLGAQYSSTAYTTPNVVQMLTTTTLNSAPSARNTALSGYLTAYAADLATLNTNLGSANSIEGASPKANGVWDIQNTQGSAFWGGNLASASPTTTTPSTNLYYLTAGSGGSFGTYAATLQDTATLSASGLVLTAAGAPVPLPPAVWLLGSGLLGLAGVARRKTKA